MALEYAPIVQIAKQRVQERWFMQDVEKNPMPLTF